MVRVRRQLQELASGRLVYALAAALSRLAERSRTPPDASGWSMNGPSLRLRREPVLIRRAKVLVRVVVLRWHKAKPFAQVDGLPLQLPACNSVFRRGDGDR